MLLPREEEETQEGEATQADEATSQGEAKEAEERRCRWRGTRTRSWRRCGSTG